MALPSVHMEGTAGADPTLVFSRSGVAVGNLRVVASSRKPDPANEGKWIDDKTCWIDVTVFGKMAENVAESVRKGDGLVITGRLQTDEWMDKTTNEKRSKIAMIADSVGPSLRFRTVHHGQDTSVTRPSGQEVSTTQVAERRTSVDTNDPWAAPASTAPTDEPPF